jgi:hypothetical protein
VPLAFLSSFLLGLFLGVTAMLHGVEKRRPGAGVIIPVPGRELRVRFNVPMIAAFLTTFGATGYLLHRYTALGAAADIVIAAALGVAGAVGSLALIAAWALPAARAEEIDERYILQGLLGTVTRPIDAGESTGEVEYEVDGVLRRTPARSVDGSAITSGTDIVIERVEDGVTHVESWTRVEQRL